MKHEMKLSMYDLNLQQREIIACKGGAFLVSAVPGSGKTTCVTHRVVALIRSNIPAIWKAMIARATPWWH